MTTRRLHAIASGRVQGVNFRWHTRQRATQLGITGWVRNLRGGQQVEVVAEGTETQLRGLIQFLHQGPPSARVDDVKVDWAEASGEFSSFGVRF